MTASDNAREVDVAGLRALLARWREPNSTSADAFALRSEAVVALPALLSAAERTARLEEALRPFARAADDPYNANDDDSEHVLTSGLTVGDLRRARAALRQSGEGK